MPSSRFLLAAAVVLTACSSGTEPTDSNPLIATTVDVGPTMTISGTAGLAAIGGLSSAVGGNLLAFAGSRSGTLPSPPTCNLVVGGPVTCTSTIDGLTLSFTFMATDSGPARYESTISGTAGGRKIQRSATSASTRPANIGTGPWSTRTISRETGTTETVSSPITATADTGDTDIRIFFPAFTSTPSTNPTLRLPRMLGTSRRVIWTKVGSATPTYWRETTTYDSSTVVRTRIETAAGVKNCSIDLGASTFKTVCN
jgi:hypothetical protein